MDSLTQEQLDGARSAYARGKILNQSLRYREVGERCQRNLYNTLSTAKTWLDEQTKHPAVVAEYLHVEAQKVANDLNRYYSDSRLSEAVTVLATYGFSEAEVVGTRALFAAAVVAMLAVEEDGSNALVAVNDLLQYIHDPELLW